MQADEQMMRHEEHVASDKLLREEEERLWESINQNLEEIRAQMEEASFQMRMLLDVTALLKLNRGILGIHDAQVAIDELLLHEKEAK